jgi:hypothetical protein
MSPLLRLYILRRQTTTWCFTYLSLLTVFLLFVWKVSSCLYSLTFKIKIAHRCILKGQCHEIFDFWFFHESVSPKHLSIPLWPVRIFFENSRSYSRLKVHHRCQRHRWQMEKNFKQKNFNNFVWAPMGSRVNKNINFCLQVHFKVSAAWYCSHYLPPVSTTQVANLPPVSLRPVANLPAVSTAQEELVAKFAAGVVDTGGKFSVGVVDTGGNSPPVSLTPAVHLDLRISPQIF